MDPQTYLVFESRVSELLFTEDGSSLDVDCARAYTEASATKTYAMMEEISAVIAASWCADVVTSVTHTQFLSSIGDQVLLICCYDEVSAHCS